MLPTTLLLLLTALTTSALPTQLTTFPSLTPRTSSASDILLQIAPKSSSCADAPVASECATSSEASPFLISAFSQHVITSLWEMACVISLIAFETSDFKYNINHFPGRAGQGTRNMQMASFNLQYASSIPALKAQLGGVTGVDGLSDDKLDAIRALVLSDQYSWASGAWFLTSQCASVRAQIQQGGQGAFTAYMGCVGAGVTSDRQAYFDKAVKAFGLSS